MTTEEKEKLPPCPECSGLRGGHANRRCSLMTLEHAQQEIINVEQRLIKLITQTHRNWQKDRVRLKKQIDFLQSKIVAIKHENNQLRKKLR